ncbi:YqfO family protein [Oceanospirillum sediminis]|uniref:NGG1p interacting factor NIF3 n=1 Tax=Oceanospirillum sediminis TaxID=2760088 RepID=A0A839IR03_9GAMM|nr:YqfO family protein [Oceanospirillum sediminis]MBB1486646.1 NGG1p interacting factor NIF3 [Oceanospirillum sediminis]
MYKLAFFVPESHLETVKAAVFATGAGKIGNYDHCCWQIKGQGQFRALEGSQPFLGQQGQIETVEEYRVELVCHDELIREAVAAMKLAHPYDEPAYDVFPLADI